MIIEVDGRRALGFDIGLDSRAFAQAKLARLITEPGIIVRPYAEGPRRIELWKPSGVIERSNSGAQPTMVVWGSLFEGDRLDLLLDESAEQDKILAAICAWTQAILALGENNIIENAAAVPLRPGAAIIAQENGGVQNTPPPSPAVFFAPPGLARLSLTAAAERYVHPDLDGMNGPASGAAFTAAAMLYRIFAGTPPFAAADKSLLHQDMREGNFLPVRFAVPGLDTRLAALIQNALEPPHGSGTRPLNEILAVVQPDGQTVSANSLIHPLSETDLLLLEKEKIRFQRKRTASVKIRRFVTRNSAILLGCCAALVAAILITVSIAQSRSRLPSTAGMEPVQVIESYYNAFGELDHQTMEACVFGGAGKNDINTVIDLFVINKTRQAYDMNNPFLVISAREWQQNGGGSVVSQVFGVTDLRTTVNKEQAEEMQYRVDYTFWVPAELGGDAAINSAKNHPVPHYRSDIVTLVRKKEKRHFNWHIAEIQRTEGRE
jgi:hypothetical protein